MGSFIESKTSVVQTSNVGFTSEVSYYLVVHTGPGHSGPVGPLLFQLCFSVSPPTVARTASLSLPPWVPCYIELTHFFPRFQPPSRWPSAGIFVVSSHTSDVETGSPVATLPGVWRYRVSAGTGRPGVSIL